MGVVRDYIDGQFKSDQQDQVGIGGFITYATIREGVSLTREVPTIYVEDGSHVNDHIIRNPLTLSIQGNISDIYVEPSPALEALQGLNNQLGSISQYLPIRTQAQISKVNGLVADFTNAVDLVDSAIDAGERIARYVGYLGSEKSNIEDFLDKIEGVHNSDTLIAIDAPHRTYKNMAITSFAYERNNETSALDFTIEAKQFRIAETIFAELNSAAPKPSKGLNGQTEGIKDQGVQDGEEVEESFVSSLIGRFSG